MPRSIHIHKSMLLRGVKFPQQVLDSSDIEATKNQASRTGRSFGGAPFRGGSRGSGRGGRGGGQMNYANGQNERPNPFAAHINPNFAPPPNAFGRGGPLPPRANVYPPPPPRGGYHGVPPSMPLYAAGPLQPPPGGYYQRPPPPQNGYGNQYGNGRNGQYGGQNYGAR